MLNNILLSCAPQEINSEGYGSLINTEKEIEGIKKLVPFIFEYANHKKIKLGNIFLSSLDLQFNDAVCGLFGNMQIENEITSFEFKISHCHNTLKYTNTYIKLDDNISVKLPKIINPILKFNKFVTFYWKDPILYKIRYKFVTKTISMYELHFYENYGFPIFSGLAGYIAAPKLIWK